MNTKLNHIKPTFAPETEFPVETLTILPAQLIAEDLVSLGRSEGCIVSAFLSSREHTFSPLND